MKTDNIEKLAKAAGSDIKVRASADAIARTVCEIMDEENITDRSTAMFYLLDRAQFNARRASAIWYGNSAESIEAILKTREYLTIALRLARSGQ